MMQRVRLTMAQALVRFLDNQYVEFDGTQTKFVNSIYGVFGHGCVVGVGQALEQGGHNLRFLQGKNEQNMALAATAYAKQKNRREIIPCVSSIGPGALNMVTAAGTASANRIPLLLLPGDTFASRQPDPVLQQSEIFSSYSTTVNDAFRAVCRYWDRIERPEQLMTAVLNAMRVLTDPADTGAVCLCLPQDVEGEAYDYPVSFFKKRVWHFDRRPITAGQLSRAAALVKASKKPMIVCGGGVRYSEAWNQLRAFAEAYNIPIGETQAGKGLIAWDHPLNLGGIGVTGGLAANVIARDADLIIGVGTRFTDFTTCSKWLFQNPEAQILAINICPFDAFKMDAEAIIADAKETLTALHDALAGYQSAYTNEIADAKARWDAEVDRLYADVRENGFSQTEALGVFNKLLDPTDIVVGSSGSLPGDMQRLWRSTLPLTYHMEYGFSCMGYEVNGAVGVKMAAPDQEVYTMLGDGSYVMAHSELYSAVMDGIKVNFAVFDNSGWGCIENLQNSQGTDTFGTTFTAPIDFAKNAESYGCKAYTVTNKEELEKAILDARKETRPVLFDIKVLPKSMTGGYESWWRVGVAEVSTSDTVAKAYQDMRENVARTRDY